MYAFPPPPTTGSCIRPPSALSSASSADCGLSSSTSNGSSTNHTPDRYLPSLLSTPAPTPFTHPPPLATAPHHHHHNHLQQQAKQQQAAALLQQQQAQQHPVVPVQGIQLNSLLYQTANLMAVNAQLRREIEQVRAASMKSGSADAHAVAAAAAAAYFLVPPPPTGGADGGVPPTGGLQLPPLLPFGAANGARMTPATAGRKSPMPDSYKTVMCQAWLEAQTCSFGENCRFAHGEHELRPMTQPQRANRKYKTKLCEKYTNTGLCPYGTRCLFIHPDIGHNAYIRPDKLEELKKRHEERDGDDTNAKMPSPVAEDGTTPPPTTVAPPPGIVTSSLPSINHNNNNNSQSTGKQPVVATVVSSPPTTTAAIGFTPIRPRQSLRPHPSWPLEPSLFQQEPSMTCDSSLKSAAEVLMAGTEKESVFSSPTSTTATTSLLPRAHSPVVGFDLVSDLTTSTPMLDCGTPCSGGSSGYLSENGGIVTPASGLSSGTASPLDALMLSGAGSSLESSPQSMLDDYGSMMGCGSMLLGGGGGSLGLTISLPPMTSSGGWGSDDDPFRTAFDIDKMAREMAKEFGM